LKPSDFSSKSPGRLVQTTEGALAFVPDPLPRCLDLDPTTARLLAKAENALGRLAGTTGRLMNPFLVGSPLLRREAILSSRIEGIITTPEELVLLEVGGAPASGHQDTQEVLNYVYAMRYGLRRLDELPVSLRLIREIHGELLRGVRGERERPGEFRDIQNFVGNKGESIHAARFVPPPVREMTVALDDLERYLHREPSKDDPPLLVELALVHYQFETIHPFRDSNGRIGRLLIPLLLCSRGHMRDPLLYLSSFFERHREQYMDSLLRVSWTGEWLTWVQFFLQAVIECAEEAVQQAEGLLALRDRYHQQFQSARSSALLQKLVDEIFQSPAIGISQAAKLLKVTPAAAAHNLRKLQEAGVLSETTGRKRGKVFIAREVMAFMQDAGGDRPKIEPVTVEPATAE
jgi:Fic family protein